MNRSRKPAWWLLYLTVPLMLTLLIVDGHLPIPAVAQQIMEPGIVVAGFGLMALWVHGNQGTLMDEEMARERWVIIEKPDPAAGADTADWASAGWQEPDDERETIPAVEGYVDPAFLPLAAALDHSVHDSSRPDAEHRKGIQN
ncbi:MAG: hypothetical protein M1482_11440 [Chloroflexi bacterium]|nr:hypothetical protein [Chloroflexota bacterium]